MSFISNILGGIGKLLESIFPFLFSALKEAWNNLSTTQQQALINSGTIGQYLKNNLTILGTDLVNLIAKDTGLDPSVVTNTLIGLAGTFGLTTTDINAAVTFLQGKLQNASSDAEWNGILNIILNAGATLLSGGTLNYVHIALGLGEWVYQTFIAPKTAAIVAASATFIPTPPIGSAVSGGTQTATVPNP
jgi:hypothetical protein